MTNRPCGEWDADQDVGFAYPPASWAGQDLDLQRTWFSAQAAEWRSLALVPASDGLSVVRLANAFATLAFRERGESIGIADLRDVPSPHLRGPIEVIRWHTRRGERVILVVRPCFRNAATLPIVRAADCAILCVALGKTRIAEARETVDRIGRDPFIGTVIVRPGVGAITASTTPAFRRFKALPLP